MENSGGAEGELISNETDVTPQLPLMRWSGRAPAPPAIEAGKGSKDEEHATIIATVVLAPFLIFGLRTARGWSSLFLRNEGNRGAPAVAPVCDPHRRRLAAGIRPRQPPVSPQVFGSRP